MALKQKGDDTVSCTSYLLFICICAGVLNITLFKKFRRRGLKNLDEQNKRDHDAILQQLIQRRKQLLKCDNSLHHEVTNSPNRTTAISTIRTFSTTDENSDTLLAHIPSTPEDEIKLLDDGSIDSSDLESCQEDRDASVCSSLTCSIQHKPSFTLKFIFRRFSYRFSSLWRKSYNYEDIVNQANQNLDYSSAVNTARRASIQIDKLVADVALSHPKPRVYAGQRNVFLSHQENSIPLFEFKQTPTGPVVTNIHKDSNAHHDLSVGDVILAINDIDVQTMSKEEVLFLIESKEIKITVVTVPPQSEAIFLPVATTPLADEIDERNFLFGDTSFASTVDEVNENLNTSLFPSISSISMDDDDFDLEGDDSFFLKKTNNML